MKNQHPKGKEGQDLNQPILQSLRLERNKIMEPYRSNFFRNGQDTSQFQPSQSSQNKDSRAKDRLKSTRIRNRPSSNLYYELESTQKNTEHALRIENAELKKIIAELKVSQFYQVDQMKLKTLLLEMDDLKEELRKIQKQNQKLRIENDFLTRTNFQLKLETTRLRKKCEKGEILGNEPKESEESPQKQYIQKKQRIPSIVYKNQTIIPQHLLLSTERNLQHQQLKQNYLLKSDHDTYQISQIPKRSEELTALSRIRSQKIIFNNDLAREKRKLSKKKTIYTQIQNDHTLF